MLVEFFATHQLKSEKKLLTCLLACTLTGQETNLNLSSPLKTCPTWLKLPGSCPALLNLVQSWPNDLYRMAETAKIMSCIAKPGKS